MFCVPPARFEPALGPTQEAVSNRHGISHSASGSRRSTVSTSEELGASASWFRCGPSGLGGSAGGSVGTGTASLVHRSEPGPAHPQQISQIRGVVFVDLDPPVGEPLDSQGCGRRRWQRVWRLGRAGSREWRPASNVRRQAPIGCPRLPPENPRQWLTISNKR